MGNIFKAGQKIWSHSVLVIVFLILFTEFSAAQNYLWPTNASTLMTSSFCEFRPRHYHAAIDIKTWNRTGYKVFAIADGYIMRVRVSAFGYGKALYLKLKDGNIVVYAHLDRFSPQLEQYVRKIRLARKQYRVDLHLPPHQFPVKRGQLIGFTGKTGIGVPHLHFELRNAKNEPINPLPYYRSVIKDKLPPLIYGAALIPLSSRASINFLPDTLFLTFKPQNEIALSDTFYLSGKVGLALKIFDRANGARNHFSFYSAKLWIDDSLVYQLKYDSFSYNQTRLVELDKNFSLYRKGKGIFHNFFKHPANTLPFYAETKTWAGILDAGKLSPGPHQIFLQIEDFFGNRAHFRLNFISNPVLVFNYDQLKLNGNDLFIRLTSSDRLNRILVYQKSTQGGWTFLPSYQILSVLNYKNRFYYSLSIPLTTDPGRGVLKFVGLKSNHTSTFPLFVFSTSEFQNVTPQILAFQIRKNWFELQIQNPDPEPGTFIRTLNKAFAGSVVFPLSPGIFQINIPWDSFQKRSSILESILLRPLPKMTLVSPGQENRLSSADGRFQAIFPAQTFYDSTIVSLLTLNDSTFSAEPPFPYRRYGKIYQLQPFDQPINHGVTIKLSLPTEKRFERGLGLYYWDRKKGWTFLSALEDSVKNQLISRVTSLETFSIIQDTLPPEIRPLQKVVRDTLFSRKGHISFLVNDEMAGIRRESQIRITLNGHWQLFEYDPEEDRVTLSVALTDQPQRMTLEVIDNVGNRAVKTYWLK